MHKERTTDFDAVVVGSGPNGLAAAITLQKQGLSVLLVEGKSSIGGGMRSAALTLPGFLHDICSAVHPLAAASPFFSQLPLSSYGLEYIYPRIAAAHPLDGGKAALIGGMVEATAGLLGRDELAYLHLMKPLVRDWPDIALDVLSPLHYPRHPLEMSAFGLKALSPATRLARRFHTPEARGLWAGMAAHSMLPLTNMTTSAIALVLMIAAHRNGWPVPRGGSVSIADALASYFIALGEDRDGFPCENAGPVALFPGCIAGSDAKTIIADRGPSLVPAV